jgi:hypothetical protein
MYTKDYFREHSDCSQRTFGDLGLPIRGHACLITLKPSRDIWMPPDPATELPFQAVADDVAQYLTRLQPLIKARPEEFLVLLCAYPPADIHQVGDDWQPEVDCQYIGDWKLRATRLQDETCLPRDSVLLRIYQRRST